MKYYIAFLAGAIAVLTIIVCVMAGAMNRQAKRIDGQQREISQLRGMVCADLAAVNKRISELPKPTPPCACGPIPAACKCEPAKPCSCGEVCGEACAAKCDKIYPDAPVTGCLRDGQCVKVPPGTQVTLSPPAPSRATTAPPTRGAAPKPAAKPPVPVCPPARKVRR